ncbi:uncharacterized protein ACJ7VT_012147 [Polymixia lowei]
MGCQCCRMIKSYIYDPSVAVDGRKSDSAGSSLYQPRHAPNGDPHSSSNKQKQGFHNLGYSKSSDGTLKLEADNNHVNRLHAALPDRELPRQGSMPASDGDLYIIQPDAPGPRWVTQASNPSQVPVYPDLNPSLYDVGDARTRKEDGVRGTTRNGWDPSVGDVCGTGSDSLSADDVDEGVGGTPEYPCDTGDEGSILSADIHTSTTSLSSADTRLPKTPDLSTVESGISVTKSGDEDAESVTDSMVEEAIAALEAATAGEDCE